jgi:sporulation protein YlmC with PRC-barrel domain
MKPTHLATATALVAFLGATCAPAEAQVAGRTTIGVSVAQVEAVAVGWSARKQIIGHDVYNEGGEKVGKVDDLIVTPDNAVSFAIVGAGGFVGVRRHHVAIPVSLLTPHAGDFVLPGATKEAIKSLPAFQYEE